MGGGGEHADGLIEPKKASAFRKGDCILLKDHPCKISNMSTSKTGKHGHAKVKFTGYDIFTGKKYEALQSSTHNMDAVIVVKTSYMVMDIDGNDLGLLDEESQEKDGITLVDSDDDNEDLAKTCSEIRKYWEQIESGEEARELSVTVTSAMGMEQVYSCQLSAA